MKVPFRKRYSIGLQSYMYSIGFPSKVNGTCQMTPAKMLQLKTIIEISSYTKKLEFSTRVGNIDKKC